MSIDQPTLEYFKRIVAQAASRGLRVIGARNPQGRGWSFDYAPLKPSRAKAEPTEPSSRRGARAAATDPQANLF